MSAEVFMVRHVGYKVSTLGYKRLDIRSQNAYMMDTGLDI